MLSSRFWKTDSDLLDNVKVFWFSVIVRVPNCGCMSRIFYNIKNYKRKKPTVGYITVLDLTWYKLFYWFYCLHVCRFLDILFVKRSVQAGYRVFVSPGFVCVFWSILMSEKFRSLTCKFEWQSLLESMTVDPIALLYFWEIKKMRPIFVVQICLMML